MYSSCDTIPLIFHRGELEDPAVEALEEPEEAPESTTEAAEEDPEAGQTEGPAGQKEGPAGLLAPILIINNSSAPQYIVVPSLGLLSANQPNQQVSQHFVLEVLQNSKREFLHLLPSRIAYYCITQKIRFSAISQLLFLQL
jgi:hypothetical protein